MLLKRLFLLLMLFISTTHQITLHAADASEVQHEAAGMDIANANDTAKPTNLQQVVAREVTTLTDLDKILSDLLNQCASQATRAQNPRDHITAFTKVRELVEPVLAEFQAKLLAEQTEFSLEEVDRIVHFNQALMSSIKTLLQSQFNDPITEPTTRSQARAEQPTEQELIEQSQANSDLFQTLYNKASVAGLSWYNRLYRAIHPYIIKPVIKHRQLLETSAKTAAIALYVLHNTRSENVQDSIFSYIPGLMKLKALVGEAVRTHYIHDSTGSVVAVQADGVNAVGSAVGWLNRLMSIHDPIGQKLLATTLGAYTVGYNYIQPKILEKLNQLDKFMLGGIHRNQKDQSLYISTKTFQDVVGMESEKEKARLLIKSVLDPETFARAGATPPGTILFIGGSRSGKTHFAEAIAGEVARMSSSDAYFFKVQPMHVTDFGGFEGLIYQAQMANIRILFIDEFHRYFKQGGNQELLSSALAAFGKSYDPRNPIIVICATNNPASLPHDLRNRFEVTVRFGATTIHDRAVYLDQELKKAGVRLPQEAFEMLVLETQSCSFEKLQRLIKEAKRQALIDKKAVSLEYLMRAFDTEVRGIIFEDYKRLSPAVEDVITANIAAETMIRFSTEDILDEKISAVTTLPYNAAIKEQSMADQWSTTAEGSNAYTRYGNVYTLAHFDQTGTTSFEQLHAYCKILVAGHVGERFLKGATSYSYRPENTDKALKIALKIVSKGASLSDMTAETRARYEKEALEYLKKVEEEVTAELSQKETVLTVLTIVLNQAKLLYRYNLLPLLNEENAVKIMKEIEQLMAAQNNGGQAGTPVNQPAE